MLTGRLLGQFQHRVAQYNYVDEREVLRRWADGYDTRLFVRRRIHETEPVAGVVGGLDIVLFQYLRVAAGGNTLVPTENVSRALGPSVRGGSEFTRRSPRAENVALHLDLPALIVAEILEDLGREGLEDFPEPPRETTEPEDSEGEDRHCRGRVAPEDAVTGGAAGEQQKPSPEDRAARRTASEDPGKGDEPSRVQDPQAKDAPGVAEEGGEKKRAAPPEGGKMPRNRGRDRQAEPILGIEDARQAMQGEHGGDGRMTGSVFNNNSSINSSTQHLSERVQRRSRR